MSGRRYERSSPEIKDFVDVCLRIPIPHRIRSEFKSYYQSLRESEEVIKFTDLGAGSKRLKTERSIAAIAKVSGSYGKFGDLLYRLGCHFQPKQVLELGTSVGLGTWMLAKGCPDAQITTIEGCPNTYNFARKALAPFPNVACVNNSFTDFLQSNDKKFDLVYIDGDHRGEKVSEMLDMLAQSMHDKTIIIIDDVRWSRDMFEYWQQFKGMKRYHLTMDLFRMGIVMNQSHLQKEHFVIKY